MTALIFRMRGRSLPVLLAVVTALTTILSRFPMPFVGFVIAHGGVVPGAYALSALPSVAYARALRDTLLPVSQLGARPRLLVERASLALGAVAIPLVTVVLVLLSVGAPAVEPRLLVSFSLAFSGLVLAVASVAGATAAATATAILMLGIFAASTLGKVSSLLFDVSSTWPAGVATCLLALGSIAFVSRGSHARSAARRGLAGLNDA